MSTSISPMAVKLIKYSFFSVMIIVMVFVYIEPSIKLKNPPDFGTENVYISLQDMIKFDLQKNWYRIDEEKSLLARFSLHKKIYLIDEKKPCLAGSCPQDNLYLYPINEKKQELARFDLEQKVYPEIQSRMTENDNWLLRKFTLMGGLLGALLFKLSQDPVYLDDLMKSPKSSRTCVILGLACIVALFIDMHIRRSQLVIMELGTWAAKYGIPIASGGTVPAEPDRDFRDFLSWEQFIRIPGPEKGGMHDSFVNAFQMGALNFITIALFSLYYLIFLDVCRKGMDWLNGVITILVLLSLLGFVIIAHTPSGNFKLNDYGLGNFGKFVSNPWSYTIAWVIIVILFFLWLIIEWRFRQCFQKQFKGRRCVYCGRKLGDERQIHIYHEDDDNDNWEESNLKALHRLCYQKWSSAKDKALEKVP